MSRPPARRVFLALWPDVATRKQIYRIQQQLAGHRALQSAVAVKQENLHLTLHFIGAVTDDVLKKLSALLNRVESPSFEMTIDHVGCFPKPKVTWLGIEGSPLELVELVRQTGECVSQCVETYQQTSFSPHITLFRKVRCTEKLGDTEPVRWKAENFALVESNTRAEGVEYSVLQQWPLK